MSTYQYSETKASILRKEAGIKKRETTPTNIIQLQSQHGVESNDEGITTDASVANLMRLSETYEPP